MIRFENVTMTYPDAETPALREVNLEISEGELCLVVGETGVGKTTLLRCINGLVPHFTGGRLSGRVSVFGRFTDTHQPREFADLVGMVGQDPLSGFVTDVVEEELAYGMEQLAVPDDVMRQRVEETLDLLGIAELRNRGLSDLSGGQQQRVAIGSVLTTHPKVLVLDEPTSALDPASAEEVLAAITRLVHDLGITVVLAEHRLERVIQYADSIVLMRGDGTVVRGLPAEIMATSRIAPPVVELGKLAGWNPLPLSVRDARRRASKLRADLRTAPSPSASQSPSLSRGPHRNSPRGHVVLSARKIVVIYGSLIAVREVSLDLIEGEVTAIMGRNGSGKTSLLWALQGSGTRRSGSVRVEDSEIAGVAPREVHSVVGLVPQTPTDLLYLDTVRAECNQVDRAAGLARGTCRDLLESLCTGIDDDLHPRDLSEGQRLCLVLAIVLAPGPPVLLLDEPTRGLDYGAKSRLADILRRRAQAGTSIALSTHDVEFVALVADRVVVLAEGEVVADGATADVISASPTFAPQVSKVIGEGPWLTVAEVADALA